MKTFLNDLRKELKKLNFSKEDIEEIITDHEEMIETAKKEGLSDDELSSKFGNPEKLALDLQDNKSEIPVQKGGEKVEGYTLLKTFPVVDMEFDFTVELINDDFKLQIHDADQVEVYGKNIKDIDEYEIQLDDAFLLKRKTKSRLFSNLSSKTPKFIVRIPAGITHKVASVKLVSGDAKMDGLKADKTMLKTTSGDIKILRFTSDKANFSTVSGDLTVSNGTVQDLDLSMVSGGATLKELTFTGTINANTVSGDLKANQVEAKAFEFRTVSGDCKGTEFYPETVSLKSVSGDIKIKNSDTAREIKILQKKALSGSVKIN